MRKLAEVARYGAWHVALLVAGLVACAGCAGEEEPPAPDGSWVSVTPPGIYWAELDEDLEGTGWGVAGCFDSEGEPLDGFSVTWGPGRRDKESDEWRWPLKWFPSASSDVCRWPYRPTGTTTPVFTWSCGLSSAGDTLTCAMWGGDLVKLVLKRVPPGDY